jgi:hypothetical protein
MRYALRATAFRLSVSSKLSLPARNPLVMAAVNLALIQEQIASAAKAAPRERGWESALRLRVLSKLLWGLEPVIGIEDISFHLLVELVRSLLCVVLGFPCFQLVQLSR